MRPALAARMLATEVVALVSWTRSDPAMARRYGFELAWRGGVACFSARRAVFGRRPTFGHQAIGFGIFAPATGGLLDRIERRYADLGLYCRIHVAAGVTPDDAVRLLRRRGYRREDVSWDMHVLEARRAPRVTLPDGLRVERVLPTDAAWFSRLTTRGFGGPPRAKANVFFERERARLLADHPRRAIAVVARAGHEGVGTGMLILGPHGAALYGGSVVEKLRGRGIQHALVAERVRIGLARGRRLFNVQTAHDGPSAHNLHELGFRHAWRMTFYSKA